tara:strand:+ start:1459 stop:1989 length:531 start_codon:yes stop_codon:yes gene_type:complete
MAVWTHLAHDSLSLPATTVTWSSISGSYDHLCIKASARYSAAGSAGQLFDVVYNGDTTDGDYTNTYLIISTTTPTSGGLGGRSYAAIMPTSSYSANAFGATTIWIPNYSNSTNYKQMLSQSAALGTSVTNDEWAHRFCATLFKENTDAITQIDMVAGGGNDFVANSTFDLYGILGA